MNFSISASKAILGVGLVVSNFSFYLNSAHADDQLRVSRPLVSSTGLASGASNSFAASATMNTEGSGVSGASNVSSASTGDDAFQLYANRIAEWEQKNIPTEMQEGTAIPQRQGLKSHLAKGAFKGLEFAAGNVVPGARTAHAFAGMASIEIEPGHCPAAFDPAFQVPRTWWHDLATEEGSPDKGPEWKLWLATLRETFALKAPELPHSRYTSCIHVIINPDGSIYNAMPYIGGESSAGMLDAKAMQSLRHIILSVGSFPPFPNETKVRCYHLIFSGKS